MNEFQRGPEMLDRWANDGPQVGGRELLHGGGEKESRPICGAEPSGMRYLPKHLRVCVLTVGHPGAHLNKNTDVWNSSSRRYVTGGGGWTNNRARHRLDVDGDAADDRAWTEAEAERRDAAAEAEVARAARLLR